MRARLLKVQEQGASLKVTIPKEMVGLSEIDGGDNVLMCFVPESKTFIFFEGEDDAKLGRLVDAIKGVR